MTCNDKNDEFPRSKIQSTKHDTLIQTSSSKQKISRFADNKQHDAECLLDNLIKHHQRSANSNRR